MNGSGTHLELEKQLPFMEFFLCVTQTATSVCTILQSKGGGGGKVDSICDVKGGVADLFDEAVRKKHAPCLSEVTLLSMQVEQLLLVHLLTQLEQEIVGQSTEPFS